MLAETFIVADFNIFHVIYDAITVVNNIANAECTVTVKLTVDGQTKELSSHYDLTLKKEDSKWLITYLKDTVNE